MLGECLQRRLHRGGVAVPGQRRRPGAAQPLLAKGIVGEHTVQIGTGDPAVHAERAVAAPADFEHGPLAVRAVGAAGVDFVTGNRHAA